MVPFPFRRITGLTGSGGKEISTVLAGEEKKKGKGGKEGERGNRDRRVHFFRRECHLAFVGSVASPLRPNRKISDRKGKGREGGEEGGRKKE